jgi:hypothetical protein
MTELEKRALIQGGVRTSKTEAVICAILREMGYTVKMDMELVEVGEGKYVAMPTMVYEEKKNV